MAECAEHIEMIKDTVGIFAAAGIGVAFLAFIGFTMVKREFEARAVELFEE